LTSLIFGCPSYNKDYVKMIFDQENNI